MQMGALFVIQIGGVESIFCQAEGILLQGFAIPNGRCIAILFKSYRGQVLEWTLLKKLIQWSRRCPSL